MSEIRKGIKKWDEVRANLVEKMKSLEQKLEEQRGSDKKKRGIGKQGQDPGELNRA